MGSRREESDRTASNGPRAYTVGWLARNGLRLLSANGLILALGMGQSVILARLLGPSGKGILFVSVLTATSAAQILGGGLGFALQYHVGRREVTEASALRIAATYSALVGGGAVLIVMVIDAVASGIFARGSIYDQLLPWLLVLLPLEVLVQSLYPVLVAVDRVRVRNAAELLHAGLGVALVLLLVGGAHLGVVGGVQAIVASLLASAVLLLIACGSGRREEGRRLVSVRSLLRFGLQQHGGAVLARAMKRLDAYFVLYFLGSAPLGVYSVASALSEPPLLASRSLYPVVISFVGTNERTYADRVIPRVFRVAAASLAILYLGYGVAAVPTLRLAFGPAFEGAVAPLVLLLGATFCLSFYVLLGGYLVGVGQPKLLTYVMALSMVVNTLASLVLIPTLGLAGNALASLLAAIVSLTLALRYFGRISGSAPAQALLVQRGDLADLKRTLRRWLSDRPSVPLARQAPRDNGSVSGIVEPSTEEM